MSAPMIFQFDSERCVSNRRPSSNGEESQEKQPLMSSSTPLTDIPLTSLSGGHHPNNGPSLGYLKKTAPKGHGPSPNQDTALNGRTSFPDTYQGPRALDTSIPAPRDSRGPDGVSEYLEPSQNSSIEQQHSWSTDSGVGTADAFSNRSSNGSRESATSLPASSHRPASSSSAHHHSHHPRPHHEPQTSDPSSQDWTKDSYNSFDYRKNKIQAMNGTVGQAVGCGVRPDSIAGRGHEYEELPAKGHGLPYDYADPLRTGLPPNTQQTPGVYPNLQKPGNISPQNSASGTIVRGSRENLVDDANQSGFRRRRNPLYDSAHGKARMSKTDVSKSQMLNFRCYCVAIVIVAVIAGAALVLAVLNAVEMYTGGGFDGESGAKEADLSTQLQELQAKYDDLLSKFASVLSEVEKLKESNASLSTGVYNNTQTLSSHNVMIDNITVQVAELQKHSFGSGGIGIQVNRVNENLASLNTTITSLISGADNQQLSIDSLEQNTEQLSSEMNRLSPEFEVLKTNMSRQAAALQQVVSDTQTSSDTFTNSLSSLRREVQANISTVSKMEGPQGPPGVGNLSACMSRTFSQGASGATVISTSWFPGSLEESQQWVVMGGECRTEGDRNAWMNTDRPDNWPSQRYQCNCNDPQSGRFFCYMYMWICPRIS